MNHTGNVDLKTLLQFIYLTLVHYFVRKNVFYYNNIQYAYDFYGNVNVYRGIFRTQSDVYGAASLQKSHKKFIVDIRLGSKYATGKGFTVE